MGSRSVTCHQTHVNMPHLNPSQEPDTRFTYPRGMEGWVDLGYPTMHRPVDHKSDAQTTTPPSYLKVKKTVKVSICIAHHRVHISNALSSLIRAARPLRPQPLACTHRFHAAALHRTQAAPVSGKVPSQILPDYSSTSIYCNQDSKVHYIITATADKKSTEYDNIQCK